MTAIAIGPSPLLSRLVRVGVLTVRLPSGSARSLRGGEEGPAVEVTIRSRRAWLRILRGGALGFAEAYMAGEVDTPDLTEFLLWGALNHEAFRNERLGRSFFSHAQRLWQRIAGDLRHQTVGSTADHYDLGNDFYATWLDDTMSYSSARFDSLNQDLSSAQRTKYVALERIGDLQPAHHVLEIGCGWGGFAEHAAGQLGCRVTAITLSQEMADFARKRMAERGLSELVDIRVEDFRKTAGTYDRIVSVEMIESIDESQWPDLFATMRARLAPGGRIALQAITIDDNSWETYRRQKDFIQRYIFPGGQLPALNRLHRLAAKNELEIVTDEAFGVDYARTLASWHQRFEQAWPKLRGGRFDEHFRRMWKLYLSYCEAGFRLRRIDVHQMGITPV